jgi:type I restriction enzyme, S subunit
MSTALKMEKLCNVAELNPKFKEKLENDSSVSFVPMAAVLAEMSTVTGEEKQYIEVSKGYTSFVDGDLLVAKITPCFENGKITQAKLKNRAGFGSTEFHVVRPLEGKLDARYLLHFLRQERIRIEGERKMTGSAGQRRIPASFLASLEIPLLPLPEQKRITDILDRAEALRAKRQEALAQLDELIQSVFLEMFGDPATNPKKWPIHQLQDVVKKGTIVTYGIVQAGEEFLNGVPYIRTGDIVEGKIAQEGLRHTDPQIAAKFCRSRVEVGEIVMSIRATVGTTALVPPELDGANLTQGTARISPGENLDRLYLLYYLRASGTQHWINQQIKGATFREITLKRLRELPVSLPPLPIQLEFSRRIATIEKLKATHRASLEELNELFSSLQYQAFRGEL